MCNKRKIKNQKAKYLKWSLIFGRAHTGRGREREEEEKRRRRGRGRISQERYGFLYTSMDVLILFGIYEVLYGLLWFWVWISSLS